MQVYTLYGTDHSYFTGKLRPYLRYKKIPYREKQVSLWTYQTLILRRTGQRFIPVLLTPQGELLQDTSDIIDEMERRFAARPIYPQSPCQRLVALLLEVYADEWFLLPGMHYRWSYEDRQHEYLMREFGRIAGPLPGPLARMVGRRISAPFRQSLKYLGVTAATIPVIERWFEGFLEDFEAHLAQHPYLLGSRPCLADFALAGPLYAHLARDPYPRAILLERAPRTLEFLQRINALDQAEGEFLPADQVPDTLLPILQHLFVEHWPILEDTAAALPDWLQQHPDKASISRAMGWHDFRIGKVTEKRLMFANEIWMMQRPLEFYASLTPAQRAPVNELLAQCDGRQAMAFELPQRLARKNYRLVRLDAEPTTKGVG